MNALASTADFSVVPAPEARWLVLTCSNAVTLRLAESLTEAGIEAWAPREIIVLRARRQHKREEIIGPLMAGFVFARTRHLHELLELAHSPAMLYQVWDAGQRKMVTKGHPHFRFFLINGQQRIIPERQLAELRRLDGLTRPKTPLRKWSVGERIRLSDGAYAGLGGIVLSCSGEQTKVQIDGWNICPTVSTRLLHAELDESQPIQLSGVNSEQAPSAKAKQ